MGLFLKKAKIVPSEFAAQIGQCMLVNVGPFPSHTSSSYWEWSGNASWLGQHDERVQWTVVPSGYVRMVWDL